MGAAIDESQSTRDERSNRNFVPAQTLNAHRVHAFRGDAGARRSRSLGGAPSPAKKPEENRGSAIAIRGRRGRVFFRVSGPHHERKPRSGIALATLVPAVWMPPSIRTHRCPEVVELARTTRRPGPTIGREATPAGQPS
jgi:hypothetical protein